MRQVSPHALWIGNSGDVRNLDAVRSVGILAIVDLAMAERPLFISREDVYCRFPLLDGPGNPPWLLRSAAECVASFLRSATPVLVFCGAGMSRSPTIAAAGLSLHTGDDLDRCLALVLADGPRDVSPSLLLSVERALKSSGSEPPELSWELPPEGTA
ncbi:MAG: dual specificity protein phosphatase [Phycisphaerales bacterium]